MKSILVSHSVIMTQKQMTVKLVVASCLSKSKDDERNFFRNPLKSPFLVKTVVS